MGNAWKSRWFLLGCLALAGCEGPAERPEGDAALDAAPVLDRFVLERIDALVAQALAEQKLPGCVVAVGREHGVEFLRAYGNRALEPAAEPMTVDTVFDLASLTKPVVTATCVFRLVDEGRVRLRDPLKTYLPEFDRPATADLTVLQLLTHTAGFVPDNALSDYESGVDEAWCRLLAQDPVRAPGTSFSYSDVGFELLGKLVERVRGIPLDEVARTELFEPLGLTETGFRPNAELAARAAPTEMRDGVWLRGEVHDPRAHLLGGVAGHAGLFSTAADLARFARALLGGGELDGARILSSAAVARMGRALDVPGGRRTPGWDAQSRFSSNRGETFTDRAFGHGGFTGTALWIDPGLDLFVVFLSNRVHPDGKGSVNDLAGRIGSVAAAAVPGRAREGGAEERVEGASPACLPGIDVLRERGFDVLRGRSVGLVTNRSAITRAGERTLDVLFAAPESTLCRVFSPEHGFGAVAEGRTTDEVDPTTGLKVHSLYGERRAPSDEDLAGLDTLVFDLQDVGARFYTYVSTMGLCMEAAARAGLRFVVLDRPDPLGGEVVEGPLRDPDAASFTAYHDLPVRHGMTAGELARMFRAERGLATLDLVVVPVVGWDPASTFAATGLPWSDPSPNLRGPIAALLYPGVALLEFCNVSVGRGTDRPFEWVGAPWIHAAEWARALNARALGGVRFVVERRRPQSSRFEGEDCEGVRIVVEDAARLRPLELGYALAVDLLRLHGEAFEAERIGTLLANRASLDALLAGADVPELLRRARPDEERFRERRAPHLLYPRAADASVPRSGEDP